MIDAIEKSIPPVTYWYAATAYCTLYLRGEADAAASRARGARTGAPTKPAPSAVGGPVATRCASCAQYPVTQ